MLFSYPNDDSRFNIPGKIIHGTTELGFASIMRHNIQTRGYDILGIPTPPKSLDFGEGFYCTYNNSLCRKQARILASTRAKIFNSKPIVISITVDSNINRDSTLKCLFFDGNINIDGLEWAEFVVFHRVNKEISRCSREPCNGHPDIIIGPVADGSAVTFYAYKVFKGDMTLLEFYYHVTKARWFPNYKQVVFGSKAIKYLSLV